MDLVVKNVSEGEVAVMWDGATLYFQPGQKKLFPEGIANGIVNDAKGLEIESDELKEVAEEVAEVEAEEEVAEVVEAPKAKAKAKAKK